MSADRFAVLSGIFHPPFRLGAGKIVNFVDRGHEQGQATPIISKHLRELVVGAV